MRLLVNWLSATCAGSSIFLSFHLGVAEPAQAKVKGLSLTWGRSPHTPFTGICKWDSVGKKCVRLAHHERAFTLWQSDFQRRVKNWQISLSYHSGIAFPGK